jgi:predicted Zn-dependent protease
MRKYLISTLLLLFAFGCASSSKNETAKQNSPENEDPIASGKMDMAYDSDLPQTPSRQTPPAAEAPKATADQLRQALQSGNSREVEAVASKLLAVNPKDTKALNALAIVQLKANKPSMARFILKKVLEIDPLNSTALNNMGVAYAIGNEENKSFTELKKAHEADSKKHRGGIKSWSHSSEIQKLL